MNQKSKYKSYNEILWNARQSELRKQTIPSTHFISLLLPTIQYGGSAYIAFSCPQQQHPEHVYGIPAAWWLLSAVNSSLQAYVPVSLLSFTQAPLLPVKSQLPANESVAIAESIEKRITELMTPVASAFFAGEKKEQSISANGMEDATLAADLYNSLVQLIDPALLPYHKALAPDFFAWLTS